MTSRFIPSSIEQVLLKFFAFVFWTVETFLIGDAGEDQNDHSTSSSRQGEAGQEETNNKPSLVALQEALKMFEIDSLADEGVTNLSVKKIWKRLSLTCHPDRNGNSKESVEKTQQINQYYEMICLELDKRDGILGDDNHDENVNSDTQDAKQPNEDISKEERNRRKKARRKAQQEAKSRWEQEMKLQKAAQEEEMRRMWEEMHRKAKEYKQQQRKQRKERIRNQKKIKEYGLNDPNRRDESFRRWWQESTEWMHATGRGIVSRHTSPDSTMERPKYLIMELCNNEIAEAIRNGETHIAIELVHERIFDVWLENNTRVDPDGFITLRMDSPNKNLVLKHVLIQPLDEDSNNVLHYAVYFRDDEMISYLIQEARRWERFEEFVTSTNKYRLGVQHFSLLVGGSVRSHIERLLKEVEERIESRKLIPTLKRQIAKFSRAPSIAPSVISIFGLVVGFIIFETGWIMALALLGICIGKEANEIDLSIRQKLLVQPGIFTQGLLIYHVYWFLTKKLYQGLAWITGFQYILIPVLLIVGLVTPPFDHSSPVVKFAKFGDRCIAFFPNWIKFPKRFSLLTKSICWLLIYFGILLASKNLVEISLWSFPPSLEQTRTHHFGADSKPKHALDVFKKFLEENDDIKGEL